MAATGGMRSSTCCSAARCAGRESCSDISTATLQRRPRIMPAMNSHAHVPDWTLVSLRPRGQHAPLRRAAEALGAQVIGLSPWALVARHDAGTRAALAQALGADRVVFSSPAAVHAAARLQPLQAPHAGTWLAVGAGTAAALRGHGVDNVVAPTRMDSEGLLDLPALAQLQGLRAALVTAPGGRGIIAS